MQIKPLSYALTVCRPTAAALPDGFFCLARTGDELSLVCETAHVPASTTAREDGWRAFRIEGVLDFSLVGILAAISRHLADAGIGIFAVSTYNTDYILVKAEHFARALQTLADAGYAVLT